VAAEKILPPLDADGGSAHTPRIGWGVPPVHAVVPRRVICDWRSWPASWSSARSRRMARLVSFRSQTNYVRYSERIANW